MELPIDESVEAALHTWLIELLQPLDLQAELVNKIIASAQDAFARTHHPEITFQFEQIHLVIFIPSKRDARKKAWSFFRLDKIEDTQDEQTGSEHAVEFYLYGEGD